ncbi:molybdopterin-binding protein [bacterium]|nr:molybdopterin-binding protein [bacterium]
MRKVSLENAVGLRLGHDITEVNTTKKIKHRAFKRGHLITSEDIGRLHDLGKHSIFVWDGDSDEIHEDDAAKTVAPLVAGKNIRFDSDPSEGKISFYATCQGLFKVDVERLYNINSLEIPSLPTLHTNFPVKKDKQVAAFRIIPLTCERSIIEKITSNLAQPLLWVEPFRFKQAGIIVTGNEVYEGRIKDSFIPKLTQTLQQYEVKVLETAVLPDKRDRISAVIQNFSATCDIIFVTGGTSVDPDDVTVGALLDAGVKYEVKGNPIQPGNNFTVGYKGDIAVCAVPAASLFFQATALDIFLPRLLAGEKIPREDFHRAGHGGLCHFCRVCQFPVCPFAIGS